MRSEIVFVFIYNSVKIYICIPMPGIDKGHDHVMIAGLVPPFFPQRGFERGLFLWWYKAMVLRQSGRELV